MDELYRRLFEGLPCYVTVQDRDFRIVAANGMYRRDFEGEIGAHCYRVYKGRTEKCPGCAVERTFQDGENHSSEEVVTLRTGEDINVITYTSPLRNEKGEIDSVVEISADITGVKRLQQKYRTLFEEVPCYISVQDRDLKIIEANHQFRESFGDAIGEYCYEAYKHRTEPCIRCAVAETFHDGKVREHEEVVTSQHGDRMNVLVHSAPIRNSAGEIDSVIEMTTNITYLRQLQSQLASVGLIVSSVSHGIKGLLSGLDGGIYLMETGFKKDNMDRVRQGWDMMQRNVERIRSMVLNILYYAKDREVYYQPIDLEEIVASVEDVVASRAKAHDVDLRVDVEPGTFEADHNFLHSLLVNLLDNSIDACRVDKDKESHWVTMSAKIVGDYAVFDAADNGIGMDRETKEKAFTLFFSSKGAEGTGLGLFIAGKIVKSHSGAIDIESSPGVGTHITVKLPRNRPSVEHHDVPVWDGGAGVGGD